MCHESWGKFLKQLWPSVIRKKPRQTCAHICLHILLFMEAHLNKLNSPHFTAKLHFYAQFPKLTTIHCKRHGFFHDVTIMHVLPKRYYFVSVSRIGLVGLLLVFGTQLPRPRSRLPRMLRMAKTVEESRMHVRLYFAT